MRQQHGIVGAVLIVIGVSGAAGSAEPEPPARALEAVAEDVAEVRAEVAQLRVSLAATLAELRARDGEADRRMIAPVEPTGAADAEREAALERLAARLDAIAIEQQRLAEQVRIAAEADAGSSPDASRRPTTDEPGRSAAAPSGDRADDADDRRREARYTRYTPGHESGYHTIRAIPTRTTGPVVRTDDDRYDGFHGRRISRVGAHHLGVIHRRGHHGHFPFHHRTFIHRRHHRHSGITLGTTGDHFFFKLRLGHSVHVNHGY